MFDISIPLMGDGNCGTSVVNFGADYEAFNVYKSEDVKLVDFVRIWQTEADAISRGRRKRGVLPSNIQRDRQGRLGCCAGWLLIREKGVVHVHDQTIGFAWSDDTFGVLPQNWWRCVSPKYMGLPGLKKIPVSALHEWSGRLRDLLYALDLSIDCEKYNLEIRETNAGIVKTIINSLPGGNAFYKIFPSDHMEQLGLIGRTCGRHPEVTIGDDGAFYRFDGLELWPRRDMEQLVWWIEMAFRRGEMVVFLDPHGNTGKGVPLFVLKPGDEIGGVLSAVLEKSRIDSDAIDHVAFCARGVLPDAPLSSGHVILPKVRYRCLLKDADRVLLGICKRTAWAEFPLRGVHGI